MTNLRKRLAVLERAQKRMSVRPVHVVLVASAAEERAEADRLAREAPNDGHVFIRLMGPAFEGWPEEAAASRATG